MKKGRANFFLTIIAISFMLVGIAMFFMPNFLNWLYNKKVVKIKQDFTTVVTSENNKTKYKELYENLKMQNESLYENKQKELKDPFSYEQPTIDLTQYGLNGNIIGFVVIPKMQIELPIYLGANSENMLKGAVHLTETSYPIGGENTNSVIAAHRGYIGANFFKDIEKLKIGDEVYIHNFIDNLTYKVCDIKIIAPTDIEELLIQDGRDLVTLITCHPYGKNYERYVVYCERAR